MLPVMKPHVLPGRRPSDWFYSIETSTWVLALMSVLVLAVGAGAVQKSAAAETTPTKPNATAATISPTTNGLSAASRYERREIHSRDGIGKFYMDREIAHVIGGDGAAEWLERPEREKEERTSRLIELLGLKEGQMVADIGCGTGYVSRRLARPIGPQGRVYAVDIQPDLLAALTNSAAREGITNIIAVLGTEKDPKLAANSLDLAVLVDVYHEFEHPFEMTEAMVRAIKPGGRIAFVEYRGEDPTVPIKLLHKMTVAQVRKEMQPHPLEWVETIGGLPWQHVIVFRKTTAH
jgi:SAM-dependent methyltransferase